jgi:hypothetical protein
VTVLLALLVAGTVADATMERQGDRLLDSASAVPTAEGRPAHHDHRNLAPNVHLHNVERDVAQILP